MRAAMIISVLVSAVAASPAVAAPAGEQPISIPHELTDPKFVERIAGMTEALSKALLDLPVGELEAAAEGRPATQADRGRTVRDIGRLTDPNFERNLQKQMVEARPRVEAAMQALARALPSMTRSLSEMADQIERATANIPQPGYPRR